MSDQKGYIICIEGVDCSGKSTLIKNLKEAFKENDRFVFLSQIPKSSLRDIILHGVGLSEGQRALLILAAAEHAAKKANACKREGKVVIVDRSYMTLQAYQIAGFGLPEAAIAEARKLVETYTPDATILLKISLETMRGRMRARLEEENIAADDIEENDDLFYRRVIDAYASFSNAPGVKQIDAENQSLPRVALAVLAVLKEITGMTDI